MDSLILKNSLSEYSCLQNHLYWGERSKDQNLSLQSNNQSQNKIYNKTKRILHHKNKTKTNKKKKHNNNKNKNNNNNNNNNRKKYKMITMKMKISLKDKYFILNRLLFLKILTLRSIKYFKSFNIFLWMVLKNYCTIPLVNLN